MENHRESFSRDKDLAEQFVPEICSGWHSDFRVETMGILHAEEESLDRCS